MSACNHEGVGGLGNRGVFFFEGTPWVSFGDSDQVTMWGFPLVDSVFRPFVRSTEQTLLSSPQFSRLGQMLFPVLTLLVCLPRASSRHDLLPRFGQGISGRHPISFQIVNS